MQPAMAKRLRVLIVGPTSPPIGGITTHVEALLGHRFNAPVECSFVNTVKPEWAKRGVPFIQVAAIVVLVRVLVSLVGRRPHVVHIHTSSYAAFHEKSIAVLLGRIVGARVLLHMHGGGFKDFFLESSCFGRLYIRAVLRTCTRVCVLSQTWLRYFADELGVAEHSLRVIPNGVAIPLLPRRSRNKRLRVLMFGHLREYKGVGDFIEAIKIASPRYPEVTFHHVGPEPVCSEATYYKELARDAGLDAVLRWEGPVPGSEKWDVLNSADVFVLPSHVEGLPIALLEAMGAGLPVIATPVGAIPEVVTHDVTGVLVPVGNPIALANAICRLIESPAERSVLAANGQAHIKRHFTFDRTAGLLEQVYQEVGSNR
jgi:glycosyltransferase involved in cell wall biosynthesis